MIAHFFKVTGVIFCKKRVYMRKGIPFMLLLFLFCSCNERKVDSVINTDKQCEQAQRDSFHNAIDIKLMAEKRQIVVSDIYLGMDKKNYKNAEEKFNKEIGSVVIADRNFSIVSWESLFDENNKLWSVELRNYYNTKISASQYVNYKSSGQVIDIDNIGYEVLEKVQKHLESKYGSPDTIINNSSQQKYVLWLFTPKRIELICEFDEANHSDYVYSATYFIKIKISNPHKYDNNVNEKVRQFNESRIQQNKNDSLRIKIADQL